MRKPRPRTRVVVKDITGNIIGAKAQQEAIANYWADRAIEILQMRNNLAREDLEYLVEKAAAMKDERLKACITTLVGWGDEERAEIETFAAIAIELMRDSSPSRLREAARKVEIRSIMVHEGTYVQEG